MKILVIICGHELSSEYIPNIEILHQYISKDNREVEYCGISNNNDFINYEHIISFQYKIINESRQFMKVCDFITNYKHELSYDWYIKFRPDIRLLEPILFTPLSDTAMNARARVYDGPKRIKYGMSINGEGIWKNVGCCSYNDVESNIVLDDHIYIFHHNVIKMGGFDRFTHSGTEHEELHRFAWDCRKRSDPFIYNSLEDEWLHTAAWKSRNIELNIIGLYLELTKYHSFSGDLNIT